MFDQHGMFTPIIQSLLSPKIPSVNPSEDLLQYTSKSLLSTLPRSVLLHWAKLKEKVKRFEGQGERRVEHKGGERAQRDKRVDGKRRE